MEECQLSLNLNVFRNNRKKKRKNQFKSQNVSKAPKSKEWEVSGTSGVRLRGGAVNRELI